MSDRIQDDLLLLRKMVLKYMCKVKQESKIFQTYPPFSIQQIVEGSLSEYPMNFGLFIMASNKVQRANVKALLLAFLWLSTVTYQLY